jgi:hypothetical protein
VDRLHVKIDNLNNPLVGFCFIRSIDLLLSPFRFTSPPLYP